MCGRFAITSSDEEIARKFRVSAGVQARRTYNAAPGMLLPIVLRRSPNRVVMAKWGFIPHWAKDPRIGYKMINARSEGIADKPAFRKAFRHQRCLVPASGFYEWKREGKERIPYYFYLTGMKLFGFAGLYEEWRDVEGKEILTFTIITTTPNDLVADVHDRMPVILAEEDEDRWLDPQVSDRGALLALLEPFPATGMSRHTVSKAVGNAENDGEELIQNIKY